MNKMRIKLSSPKIVSNFVNVCSKYDCDINVYDGSIFLDAKSIVAIFGIMQGKEIEVQAITSDESVISRFIEDMRKFET